MGKQYPLLIQPEVEKILKKLNFAPKNKHSRGSHVQWEGYTKNQRRVVTVDKLKKKTDQYSHQLMNSMIRQSGLSKEEFHET